MVELLESTRIPVFQFLSLPIYNAQADIVGVVQLVNKVIRVHFLLNVLWLNIKCMQVDGKSFTSSDKKAVESFALFCGMAIHNAQTYETVSKLSAKQKVALECLSYHSRANDEEVERLENESIPSTDYYSLARYKRLKCF